jgi:hypothetical protein
MPAENIPKRRGRPPEGLGKKGEPSRIRDYPRQLFTMLPITKARLKAIAEHQGRAEWRVVDDSITSYFDQLPLKDRRAVETIMKMSAAKI